MSFIILDYSCTSFLLLIYLAVKLLKKKERTSQNSKKVTKSCSFYHFCCLNANILPSFSTISGFDMRIHNEQHLLAWRKWHSFVPVRQRPAPHSTKFIHSDTCSTHYIVNSFSQAFFSCCSLSYHIL